MQPRTKKLLGFLTRPNIDELILFLSRGPVNERTVRKHLDVSQSTANRALRDLEDWGLATSEVPGRAEKRGRKGRYWRLARWEAVSFLDRADAFMNDLLQQQAQESQALTDKARRNRVRDADATDESAA
jgi:predicted ArsR family transcriptional regulator